MFDRYLKLLAEFVKFKSIATDSQFKPEIEKAAEWLRQLFATNGFSVEVWRGKTTSPVVFASIVVDKKLPTLLIYGHYDVQPATKSDGWSSEPFQLKVGKSKLFARGVIDNKGQVLIHIASAFDLIKRKSLKFNLKFLIEGNEETGNDEISGLMRKNKKKLDCDIVMVSDGELTNNKPTLEVSLRGGFNCTLKYKTGKNSLHSGLAGGSAPNAAQEIVKFLSSLYTSDNKIGFKNFYTGIDKITPAQFENNRNLLKDSIEITKLLGIKKLLNEPGLDFFTQTGLRSTIQITGIKTGYIDEGYANIVPATAEARLNFRLAPSQDPKKVKKSFEIFVKANTPKYVDYSLSFVGLHSPIKIDLRNPYFARSEAILKEIYGTKVGRRNVGGAIPFVADVKEILGVDTLLIPLVNEDCNMHGTDENFDIDLAKKALEFSNKFLSQTLSVK